jgi:tripartite-type tricarboxylate transporter receptor subunit TctC
MFRRAAGIDVTHVPYKGSAQALLALASGEVQYFIFPVFTGSSSQVASGRLRVLAVTAEKRSPLAPDVPTMLELGYDIVTPSWHLLVAPAGTPGPVVQRLAAEVQRINALEEMRRIFASQGSEPSRMTPEELKRYVAAEHTRYRRVVREAGITGE